MRKYLDKPASGTVWELVKWGTAVLKASGRPDADIDSKLLMCYLLNWDSTTFLLNRASSISKEHLSTFEALILKRAEGIPLQHLTHEQEFMGFSFYVDENVLIPRQDTETLVEIVSKFIKQDMCGIDIGTGSGCIGISLALLHPSLKMTLLDVSEQALSVAERNVKTYALDTRISLCKSDVFSGYTGDKVDFIVSNPPYISLTDMEELMIEVKAHEPHLALTDGGDGLFFYRKISKQAKQYLKEGGLLAYEIGYDQGAAVEALMLSEGYVKVKVFKDLAGQDRVVAGYYKL